VWPLRGSRRCGVAVGGRARFVGPFCGLVVAFHPDALSKTPPARSRRDRCEARAFRKGTVMLVGMLHHLRHNVIAYVALFFALTGTATAASAVIHVGDPAGGDLTGTYPDPQLAPGAVGLSKIAFFDGIVTDDSPSLAPQECRGKFGRVVPGAQLTDIAIARPVEQGTSEWPLSLVYHAEVEKFPPAGNYIGVTICNVGTLAVDPPETTWRLIILR
jgi:hypothetical protein